MTTTIDSTLQEHRLFVPPQAFAAAARIKSRTELATLQHQADQDHEAFWADLQGTLWRSAPAGRVGARHRASAQGVPDG